VDIDISAGGLVALPDGAGPTGHPNTIVGVSKHGYAWLMDRTAMTPPGMNFSLSANNTLQFFLLPGGVSGCTDSGNCLVVFSSPAYWRGDSTMTSGVVYFGTVKGPILAFPLSNGMLQTAPSSGAAPATAVGVPSYQSSEIYGYPSATPVISASGTTPNTGLVWALDNNANGTPSYSASTPLGPAVLRAYNATNLQTLYSSANKLSDAAGNAVKFTVPVVANGHVYVAGGSQLTVYGLAP